MPLVVHLRRQSSDMVSIAIARMSMTQVRHRIPKHANAPAPQSASMEESIQGPVCIQDGRAHICHQPCGSNGNTIESAKEFHGEYSQRTSAIRSDDPCYLLAQREQEVYGVVGGFCGADDHDVLDLLGLQHAVRSA